MSPLQDWLLWMFLAARIVYGVASQRPILDGYHLRDGPIWKWEETHVIIASALELPLFLWLTTWTARGLHSTIGLPEIIPLFGLARITTYTLVMGGILLPIRWAYPWLKTLQDVKLDKIHAIVRASGFLSCILFGTTFGVTMYVSLHPSAQMIRFHLGQHIVIVSALIQQFQAVLGLKVAQLVQIGSVMADIFVNNATLALVGSGVSLIGGLAFGLGITMGLIMAVNAAIIGGVFAGVIIRNSIVAGKPLLAAPIAYLASFGVFHGFLEFIGIVITFTGAGFITLGLVKGRTETGVNGAKVAGFGLSVIAFAAFTEVFIDPRIVGALKVFLVIKPSIVPVEISSTLVIGAISTLATSAVLTLAVAWAIRGVVTTMEGQL